MPKIFILMADNHNGVNVIGGVGIALAEDGEVLKHHYSPSMWSTSLVLTASHDSHLCYQAKYGKRSYEIILFDRWHGDEEELPALLEAVRLNQERYGVREEV